MDQADLQRLLRTITRRVARLLVRDVEHAVLDLEPGGTLDQLRGASIHYRIAIGPHAGRKALTLRTVAPEPDRADPSLLAKEPGFSLHAATVCEAHQRDRLEKLCRYITRPAIAEERISVTDSGQVLCRFKQPFRDGSTHVVLNPLDFMARLAALVPRPRLNLTRFHGVFAPNCKQRKQIVPGRNERPKEEADQPRAPMTWMQRLKRVFAIDIETCPDCGGRLRVIACIEEPDLIRQILADVRGREGSPEYVTPAESRAPPMQESLFDHS